jgi:hypothetical protein
MNPLRWPAVWAVQRHSAPFLAGRESLPAYSAIILKHWGKWALGSESCRSAAAMLLLTLHLCNQSQSCALSRHGRKALALTPSLPQHKPLKNPCPSSEFHYLTGSLCVLFLFPLWIRCQSFWPPALGHSQIHWAFNQMDSSLLRQLLTAEQHVPSGHLNECGFFRDEIGNIVKLHFKRRTTKV